MPKYIAFIIAFLVFANTAFAITEESSTTVIPISQITLTLNEKQNILITEFMPDPIDGSEWVELHNNNDFDVSLVDWYIDDSTSNTTTPVKFSIDIPTKSFVLLKTNKTMFNNDGDSVCLLDESKSLLHEIKYKKTIKGYSIQKLETTWYITELVTPEEKNIILPTLEPTPVTYSEESIDVIVDKSKEAIFSNDSLNKETKKKIYITEFYPNPDVDENEWVELYNNNDFDVSLVDWYIDDVIGSGGSPYKFSLDIPSKSHKVLQLKTGLLNNSIDSVALLDENKIPLHIVEYKKTIKKSSIQKLSNGKWYITSTTTPEKENQDYIEYTTNIDLNLEEVTVQTVPSPTQTPILGNILGSSTEYKVVPYYRAELPYTVGNISDGRVFVVTEKDMPNLWQQLHKFFEKAFW